MEDNMGARRKSLVRKVRRGNKLHRVIDFFYVDKHGHRQRYRRDAKVQTAMAADAEAQQLWLQAVTTKSLGERATVPTFASFVTGDFDRLFMPQYRPATRRRYRDLFRQTLLNALGSRSLDEIGPRETRALASGLQQRGLQVRPHINLVRTVLRAAYELELIESMPDIPRLEREGRKLPEAPSDEDVELILEKARGWLRYAAALTIFAGLRQGEVRAIEVRDIDLKQDIIRVRRAFSDDEVLTPKSGHERIVPLIGDLRPLLVEAVRGKLPMARIVITGTGRTPSRQYVLTALKNLEERIGMRPWSFHSLRHYFITSLSRRGVFIEAVRLLAGHSSLAVTQRYMHATANDLKEAMSRLKK
jgi:integrase/recombinase XerD